MAKTITQRIAFEGGKEMEAQLKRLGEVGVRAFGQLKSAADAASGFGAKLLPVVQAVSAKLKEIGEVSARVKRQFDDFSQSVDVMARRIRTVALVVAGVVGGFVALAASVGKSTEEIELAAKAAGLNTTKFQELKNAFDIAGIGGDELSALFNRMNKTLGDSTKQALETQKKFRDLTTQFQRGEITATQYLQKQEDIRREATEAVNVFTRLGVSAETAMNDPDKALRQLLNAFRELPDGIEKSSLELEIFGRRGTKLASIASEGEAGLDKLIQTAKRVAPALEPAQLAIGQKMDDAFDTLRLAITNTTQRFVLLFGPSMTKLLNSFTDLIVNNRDKLFAFGKSIVAALDPIINDLVAVLNGEAVDPNGFIGRVSAAVIQLAADVRQAISIIVASWAGFVAVLDVVARAINSIFGTNLSGQALAIAAAIGVLSGAFGVLFSAIGLVISVVAGLVTIFGAANLAIAALGAVIGFVLGRLLIDALAAIPAAAQAAWQALVEGFNGTLANFQTLLGIFTGLFQLAVRNVAQFFTDGFRSAVDAVKGFFGEFGTFATDILQGILSFVQRIIEAARAALSAVAGVFGGGGGDQPPGFARGGHARAGGTVRGPGSTTSDSILAWLSDQEFVVKARAVKHYGVNFMNRINSMSLPKSALAGFADGGLVRALQNFAPIPAFADGGLAVADSIGALAPAVAGAGRPFTLQIGDEMFGGLQAEDRTVERLQRFASRRAIQSAGRKPLWIK